LNCRSTNLAEEEYENRKMRVGEKRPTVVLATGDLLNLQALGSLGTPYRKICRKCPEAGSPLSSLMVGPADKDATSFFYGPVPMAGQGPDRWERMFPVAPIHPISTEPCGESGVPPYAHPNGARDPPQNVKSWWYIGISIQLSAPHALIEPFPPRQVPA